MFCPANGSAPGCFPSLRVPRTVDGARLTRIGISTLVIMLVMLAMSGQLGSRICRLCFGTDMRLGRLPDVSAAVQCRFCFLTAACHALQRQSGSIDWQLPVQLV